jgi:hypothetical protein
VEAFANFVKKDGGSYGVNEFIFIIIYYFFLFFVEIICIRLKYQYIYSSDRVNFNVTGQVVLEFIDYVCVYAINIV